MYWCFCRRHFIHSLIKTTLFSSLIHLSSHRFHKFSWEQRLTRFSPPLLGGEPSSRRRERGATGGSSCGGEPEVVCRKLSRATSPGHLSQSSGDREGTHPYSGQLISLNVHYYYWFSCSFYSNIQCQSLLVSLFWKITWFTVLITSWKFVRLFYKCQLGACATQTVTWQTAPCTWWPRLL